VPTKIWRLTDFFAFRHLPRKKSMWLIIFFDARKISAHSNQYVAME
jgi:hypothetical protein